MRIIGHIQALSCYYPPDKGKRATAHQLTCYCTPDQLRHSSVNERATTHQITCYCTPNNVLSHTKSSEETAKKQSLRSIFKALNRFINRYLTRKGAVKPVDKSAYVKSNIGRSIVKMSDNEDYVNK